jgi:hypothetical protein
MTEPTSSAAPETLAPESRPRTTQSGYAPFHALRKAVVARTLIGRHFLRGDAALLAIV